MRAHPQICGFRDAEYFFIKIFVLHIIAGAGHGGAETFCLDTILALHAKGMRQRVICRPHDHFIFTLQKHGIPYDTMTFSRLDRLWRGKALIKRVVALFKPDLVHAWLGRAASFVPGDLNVPVLGWFGGYYDLKRYKTSDFYMGVTEDIVRHIKAASGTPDKVFLGRTFGTLEKDPPLDRASLQTPAGAPVVLLLSRMHHKKGIDVLLRAASLLPGFYFWLAGEGPERQSYEAMAKDLNLLSRVRFLGWRNDRAALLEAADICALPSRFEPFGTVIAEAWYMKTPLVATKADGALHHVTHGSTGLLCEIDDAEDLAAQIKLLIEDKNLGSKLADKGFAVYQTNFSKDVVLENLIKTYVDIVNARGNFLQSVKHVGT